MPFTLATQALGSLELMVMQLCWQHGSITIRHMHRAIYQQHDLAYTTVMTTANRLVEKGLLIRQRDRNQRHAPFVYVPAVSRGAFLGMALNKMCSDLGATANDMRDFQTRLTMQSGVLALA